MDSWDYSNPTGDPAHDFNHSHITGRDIFDSPEKSANSNKEIKIAEKPKFTNWTPAILLAMLFFVFWALSR